MSLLRLYIDIYIVNIDSEFMYLQTLQRMYCRNINEVNTNNTKFVKSHNAVRRLQR